MVSSDEWDPESEGDNSEEYPEPDKVSDFEADDDSEGSDWSEGSHTKIGQKRRRKSTKIGGEKVQILAEKSVLNDSQFQKRAKQFRKETETDEGKELNGLVLPNTLWDKLKNHQKAGVTWLWKRFSHNEGGILGDEMVQFAHFLDFLSAF